VGGKEDGSWVTFVGPNKRGGQGACVASLLVERCPQHAVVVLVTQLTTHTPSVSLTTTLMHSDRSVYALTKRQRLTRIIYVETHHKSMHAMQAHHGILLA
jgi:hypothetical protein